MTLACSIWLVFSSPTGSLRNKSGLALLTGAVLTLLGFMLQFALTYSDQVGADKRRMEDAREELRTKLGLDRVTPGIDLAGRDLSHFNLAEHDFSEAHLGGADLSDTALDRAILLNADLAGARLVGATGDQTDFTGADLSRGVLRSAVFDGAKFDHAVLEGASLEKAALRAASFTEADLRSATFRGARLAGSTFEGAGLSDADLRATCLIGASFAFASMPGADLRENAVTFKLSSSTAEVRVVEESGNVTTIGVPERRFRARQTEPDCVRGGSQIGGRPDLTHLHLASFLMADLKGANLRDTTLAGVDLRADLRRADLRGADLRGALLEGGSWGGSVEGSKPPESATAAISTLNQAVSRAPKRGGPPASRVGTLEYRAEFFTEAELVALILRAVRSQRRDVPLADVLTSGATKWSAALRSWVKFGRVGRRPVRADFIAERVYQGTAEDVGVVLTPGNRVAADLRGAIYSSETQWPAGFNVGTSGAVLRS